MRAFKILLALGALAFGAPALADPSPSLVTTSQVTCSNTASLLVAAQPSQLSTVTIQQGGSNAFYIGPANVTTSNGFVIPGTSGSSFTFSFAGPLYCVTASSTSTVYVIQTVKGG